ncbi:hypothetical protein VNO77_19473 [Canavalia gladiata]|uniref:Uncharacterized protein n=1 Tax=Canavalia gladiata TaxID=3824 RepID=A0AAN9QII9_CANGL
MDAHAVAVGCCGTIPKQVSDSTVGIQNSTYISVPGWPSQTSPGPTEMASWPRILGGMMISTTTRVIHRGTLATKDETGRSSKIMEKVQRI